MQEHGCSFIPCLWEQCSLVSRSILNVYSCSSGVVVFIASNYAEMSYLHRITLRMLHTLRNESHVAVFDITYCKLHMSHTHTTRIQGENHIINTISSKKCEFRCNIVGLIEENDQKIDCPTVICDRCSQSFIATNRIVGRDSSCLLQTFQMSTRNKQTQITIARPKASQDVCENND